MTAAAVRTLRDVQDEARAALRELCDSARRPEMRDDGRVTAHEEPSLLEQLRDAVSSSTSRGTRGRGTAIPVSADALDLLAKIEAGAIRLATYAQVTVWSGIEPRLRAVVARAGQWTDIDAVAGVKLTLQGWVKAIRLLLDPPRRLHIAGACPRCDKAVVWRYDETLGEDLQHPALAVDPDTGCDCLACGAHWEPNQFLFLANLLGCPPIVSDEGGSAA